MERHRDMDEVVCQGVIVTVVASADAHDGIAGMLEPKVACKDCRTPACRLLMFTVPIGNPCPWLPAHVSNA